MRGMRHAALVVIASGMVAAGAGCERARLPFGSGGPPPLTSEATFTKKSFALYTLRMAADGKAPLETMVGKSRTHRVRQGETLLDVARWYDLGYNEIVEANPDVDPWLPPVGTAVVVPSEWVLPCCRYEGLVLNIPEMRLYYYRRAKADAKTLLVETYPVGLGRDDRRTPRGQFKVTGKTVNPRWNVPESIRKEHIRERGDDRTTIPGGDPDNPLGKYRIELSIPLYSIHGTNVPWGAGMKVSHGCVRLYPEDIEHLFPLVTVGTPVEFAYQPVKAGTRGGATFVEVHDDVYRLDRSRLRSAMDALARRGLASGVDQSRLQGSLERSRGMPVRLEARSARGRPAS